MLALDCANSEAVSWVASQRRPVGSAERPAVQRVLRSERVLVLAPFVIVAVAAAVRQRCDDAPGHRRRHAAIGRSCSLQHMAFRGAVVRGAVLRCVPLGQLSQGVPEIN